MSEMQPDERITTERERAILGAAVMGLMARLEESAHPDYQKFAEMAGFGVEDGPDLTDEQMTARDREVLVTAFREVRGVLAKVIVDGNEGVFEFVDIDFADFM